jgi:hypothetical protein
MSEFFMNILLPFWRSCGVDLNIFDISSIAS